MRGGAAIGVPGSSDSAGIAGCSARSQPTRTPSSNSSGSRRACSSRQRSLARAARRRRAPWRSCAVPVKARIQHLRAVGTEQSALASPRSISLCRRRHALPPARRSVWCHRRRRSRCARTGRPEYLPGAAGRERSAARDGRRIGCRSAIGTEQRPCQHGCDPVIRTVCRRLVTCAQSPSQRCVCDGATSSLGALLISSAMTRGKPGADQQQSADACHWPPPEAAARNATMVNAALIGVFAARISTGGCAQLQIIDQHARRALLDLTQQLDEHRPLRRCRHAQPDAAIGCHAARPAASPCC